MCVCVGGGGGGGGVQVILKNMLMGRKVEKIGMI